MRQVTFNLTQDDFEKIERLAQLERRSKASLVRNIVFKKIEEIEQKPGDNNAGD